MSSKHRFSTGVLIRGTALLTVAGMLTRLLGLLNRVCLSRLIGAEGLGLFQMVTPFYVLLAVMVSLGLPGAVTKMVADCHARGDRAGQERVHRLALRIAVGAALITAFSFWIILFLPLPFIPDRRILPSLRLMPPALLFISLSAILRSYFQGRSEMLPIALSQISEQVVRVGTGLLAVFYFLPCGLEAAAAGIVTGMVAGEIGCYGTLLLFRRRRNINPEPDRSREPSAPPLFPTMACLALPILIIRLSTAVTQMMESLLIPARLQTAGFTPAQATVLFGQLSGMAMPLLFLPTVFLFPMNTALVPAVAGAVTLNKRRRLRQLVGFALGASALLGIVSAVVLFRGASFLAGALYGNAAAAPLVTRLAPLAPPAYLQFTTASILYGFGRPGVAVANDLAGTALSLVMIYYLTADPAFGIAGVVWGYSAAFILIAVLDLYCIYRFMTADAFTAPGS